MADVGERIICCVSYVARSKPFRFVSPLTQHIKTNLRLGAGSASRKRQGRGTSAASSSAAQPADCAHRFALKQRELMAKLISERAPVFSVGPGFTAFDSAPSRNSLFSFSHREPTADVCFVLPVGNWERGTELSGAQQWASRRGGK